MYMTSKQIIQTQYYQTLISQSGQQHSRPALVFPALLIDRPSEYAISEQNEKKRRKNTVWKHSSKQRR